ncbi:hypothetical protein BZA70DRAFT_289851 [Myxozyma melibiosi]|uniref:F-box domain-containing protein n=1 Tax=Myxozyma melibiosi TaxID=54550 RepID=A0ABR1F605_9ASCO
MSALSISSSTSTEHQNLVFVSPREGLVSISNLPTKNPATSAGILAQYADHNYTGINPRSLAQQPRSRTDESGTSTVDGGVASAAAGSNRQIDENLGLASGVGNAIEGIAGHLNGQSGKDSVRSAAKASEYEDHRASAMYASQCNQYLTAIVRFTKMEFNHGLGFQELYHRALACLGKKLSEFALADALTMISINKSNYRGYWIAGLAYERLSKLDEARDIYATGVYEIDELVRQHGRSFSGLVSGKLVLNGCMRSLDARIAARDEELLSGGGGVNAEDECMSVSELAGEISMLSISTPPPQPVPVNESSTPSSSLSSFSSSLSSSTSFSSVSPSTPTPPSPHPSLSGPKVDPSTVLPLELLIQILDYVPLTFRTAVQLESLNRTWRTAVRAIPRFWQKLDLRAINWQHVSPRLLREYVDAAAATAAGTSARGVRKVKIDWVMRNDEEVDNPVGVGRVEGAIAGFDTQFDERWYELVWWTAAIYREQKSAAAAAALGENLSTNDCIFELTPCIPFLSRHRPLQDGMLAVQWGPTEQFIVPQTAVAPLLETLALRNNRPGNLWVLRIQRLMLMLERWDGGMEAPWERKGFECEV